MMAAIDELKLTPRDREDVGDFIDRVKRVALKQRANNVICIMATDLPGEELTFRVMTNNLRRADAHYITAHGLRMLLDADMNIEEGDEGWTWWRL